MIYFGSSVKLLGFGGRCIVMFKLKIRKIYQVGKKGGLQNLLLDCQRLRRYPRAFWDVNNSFNYIKMLFDQHSHL